jgi:hypothetical protein
MTCLHHNDAPCHLQVAHVGDAPQQCKLHHNILPTCGELPHRYAKCSQWPAATMSAGLHRVTLCHWVLSVCQTGQPDCTILVHLHSPTDPFWTSREMCAAPKWSTRIAKMARVGKSLESLGFCRANAHVYNRRHTSVHEWRQTQMRRAALPRADAFLSGALAAPCALADG